MTLYVSLLRKLNLCDNEFVAGLCDPILIFFQCLFILSFSTLFVLAGVFFNAYLLPRPQ